MNNELRMGVLLPQALQQPQKAASVRHKRSEGEAPPRRPLQPSTTVKKDSAMNTQQPVVIEAVQPAPAPQAPVPQPAPQAQPVPAPQPVVVQRVIALEELLAAGVKLEVAVPTIKVEAAPEKGWKGHAADVGKVAGGVAIGGGVLFGLYALGAYLFSGEDAAV